MQRWFTVYFSDIGHSCYDQLTPVKTRYPLTSIRWPYRRLKCTAHRGQVFFEVDRWPSAGFQLDRGLMSGYLVVNRVGLFGSLLKSLWNEKLRYWKIGLFERPLKVKKNGIFLFVISPLVPEIFKIFVLCKLGTDDVIGCVNMEVKTQNREYLCK